MLVDFYDVYENVNGNMVHKELKLPSEKLPFILIEDELRIPTSFSWMDLPAGWFSIKGEITARVLTTDGIVKSSDTELVPIIETFIKEHVEFYR